MWNPSSQTHQGFSRAVQTGKAQPFHWALNYPSTGASVIFPLTLVLHCWCRIAFCDREASSQISRKVFLSLKSFLTHPDVPWADSQRNQKNPHRSGQNQTNKRKKWRGKHACQLWTELGQRCCGGERHQGEWSVRRDPQGGGCAWHKCLDPWQPGSLCTVADLITSEWKKSWCQVEHVWLSAELRVSFYSGFFPDVLPHITPQLPSNTSPKLHCLSLLCGYILLATPIMLSGVYLVLCLHWKTPCFSLLNKDDPITSFFPLVQFLLYHIPSTCWPQCLS